MSFFTSIKLPILARSLLWISLSIFATSAWGITFTTNASSDSQSPIITASPNVQTINSQTIKLTWSTDKSSDSRVRYGPTSVAGTFRAGDAEKVTAHSIVISGLQPSTNYNFHVTSADPAGNFSAESSVSYTTPAPAFAVNLLAVKSRKLHGAAGAFDLLIDKTQTIADAVTVEPRRGGNGHTIVFQFSGPVSATGNVTVTPIGSATAAYVANEVIVALTGVPNNQRVTIELASVNGAAFPLRVSLGFLVGDMDNSWSVNFNDITAVKARAGQTSVEANFKYDLNISGDISAADISAVKARSNQ